jgi:hypothetical protein
MNNWNDECRMMNNINDECRMMNFLKKMNKKTMSTLRYSSLTTFVIQTLFLFQATFSFGKNIYVATDGNDTNDGTISQPFLTINKAAQTAIAGDVVIIKSGTYFPTTLINVKNSGTSTAPIMFVAEKKGEVIIDGSKSTTPTSTDRLGLFTILGTTSNYKTWIVIDGLRIINSTFVGFYSRYSDNITIKNCSSYNTGASGIIGANSSNIKVFNNKVQQACMFPNSSIGTNECITMASVNTFEVAYNSVSDRMTDPSNGGEGIDAKNNCINGSIHHNTVSKLKRLGIYIDAYQGNLSNVEVYANKVFQSVGGGITVASEKGGKVKNIKIHDNLVYNVEKFGIRIAGYLDNGPINELDVYQNTVYNCGYVGGGWENCGFLLEATNSSNSGFNIINNIISDCPIQVRDKNQIFPVNFNNNVLNGNTIFLGTNAITSNPLFKNTSTFDFSLKANSPAIDKAIDQPLSLKDFNDAARPIGNGSDIGAFEFNPTTSTAGVENNGFMDLKIYPNPSQESLRVTFSLSFSSIFTKHFTAEIVNLQGTVLQKKQIECNTFNDKNEITFLLNDLLPGSYILNFYDEKKQYYTSKVFFKY